MLGELRHDVAGPGPGAERSVRPAPAPAALEDLDFTVEAGQRVAVLGPNGGGKTTLFRVLLGQLQPTAGTVAVERCAVVPQTERSRLDFPVSALDVALMGAISRLPWWRRPGRQERAQARRHSPPSGSPTAPTTPSAISPVVSGNAS